MKYLALLIVLSSTLLCHAANVNAASCSQTDVQSAINSASAGDTVIIPAGTCTYTTTKSSTPSVNVNKSVTVQGQTSCTGRASTLSCVDNTIVTDSTGAGFQEDPLYISASGARLTGVTIRDTRGVTDAKGYIETAKGITGWRIDHNNIQSNVGGSGTGECVEAHGYGLIDHNFCKNAGTAFPVYGDASGDAHYPGDISWTLPMTFGTANSVVIEDNELDYTAAVLNGEDNYAGARITFRFNDLIGANIGSHGLDSGGLRSALQYEVYGNTSHNPGSHIYQWFTSRGGSAYVFNNTIDPSGGSYDLYLDLRNYRSHCGSGECGSWGDCDGTSVEDHNTSGQQGYVCRDQIGRGTESSPSKDWPTVTSSPVFSEQSYPDYAWGNSWKGSAPTIANVNISGYLDGTRAQAYHIINNRDFYIQVASFDGTQGIGNGVLASRPSTCTTGVAYWATDQGSWNQSGSGGQGQLYQCSATNTWSLYYTPYTYPHPLQDGSGPPPPQNLVGTVN